MAEAVTSPNAAASSATVGFTYENDVLRCDGLPIDDIANEVTTPCYLYSAGTIGLRYRLFAAALADTPHALHYALKANSTLALVELLRSLGVRADANSVGEIEVALRAGFAPRDIVFTGVGKSRHELARAVGLDVQAINAESAGELARIDELAQAQGRSARVALRVNPDVDPETHPHISTGQRHNKFGVPIADVPALVRTMHARAGLHVVGLHVHLGSQMTSLEPISRAVAAIVPIARALKADNVPLDHLDLGGGLGISYDEAPVPDFQAYAAILEAAARDTGLSLVLEPGRALIGPAGALVARVVDVKPHHAGHFVVLDAGMTELLRPALYGAFHRIVPVERRDSPVATCDIVGPVCESSDILGLARRIPLPQVDDLVAILDAGAYGSAMASNYNRRPFPVEVLVQDGAWRIIRRRQSVDDMLASEI
ncbi:MAG: diaminopimelate decarboxylase [Luteitalea sp.]|nr:diaminopimelate decarboxylase [Luteitalea sp.]